MLASLIMTVLSVPFLEMEMTLSRSDKRLASLPPQNLMLLAPASAEAIVNVNSSERIVWNVIASVAVSVPAPTITKPFASAPAPLNLYLSSVEEMLLCSLYAPALAKLPRPNSISFAATVLPPIEALDREIAAPSVKVT